MEKEKITDLRCCGYPNLALQEGQKKDKKVKTSAEREHQGEQSRFKTHVVLPYVQGLTEWFQQVFMKHDIVIHSKPRYALKRHWYPPRTS